MKINNIKNKIVKNLLCLFLLTIIAGINGKINAQYVSCTVTQTTSNVGQNTQKLGIIGINVVVTNPGTPVTITGFDFTTNGTTNNADIVKADLYYGATSGTNPVFATTLPVVTYNAPNGAFTMNFNQTLPASSSAYTFTLMYEITENANVGNKLDAECLNIFIDGVAAIVKPNPAAPAGNKTIVAAIAGGTTFTIPGSYPKLSTCLNDINAKGIKGTGGIQVLIADGTTITETGTLVLAWSLKIADNNPIIIKQSGIGTRPIINSNQTSLFEIAGQSNITIDGLDFKTTATNPGKGIMVYATWYSPIKNITIKNCKITLNKTSNDYNNVGIAFSAPTNTGKTSAIFKNILIDNNYITSAKRGIHINDNATTSIYPDEDITISNNTVTDLTGGAFLLTRDQKNFKVFNNTFSGSGSGTGIDISYSNFDTYFYNNKISGINNSSATAAVTAVSIGTGTVYAYNNMIYDIKAEMSNNANAVVGIKLGGTTTKFYLYNNTIALNFANNIAGSGSACLLATGVTSIDLANNIFANLCTGTIKACAIKDTKILSLNATSNNNLYYTGNPSATNLISVNPDYITLNAYQAATAGQDSHAITELPPFIDPLANVHLKTNVATAIAKGGKAIATPISITTDIDGEARHSTNPDIGSDEGNFIPKNIPPTIDAIAKQGLTANNAPEQTINLTGISDGNPFVIQNISILAVSSNLTIVPNPVIEYNQGNNTAQLKYTPAGTGKGDVTITVKVKDNGDTELNASDSAIISFVIPIYDPNINNTPTVTAIGNQTHYNSDGLQTLTITGINDGDPTKTQNITVSVTTQQTNIITAPQVTYNQGDETATFTYTTLAAGTATVSVMVKDDGGIAFNSTDSVVFTFDVVVKDMNAYGYSDDFYDGANNWWVATSGQYKLTEADGNLKIKGYKNTKWTSFGVNLSNPVDISENPYMQICAKAKDLKEPFKMLCYIGDGIKSANVYARFSPADEHYTNVFIDFSGQNVNYKAITQIFFAINGNALTWTGDAWFDNLQLGAYVKKAANISAVSNKEYSNETIQRTIQLTDISYASAIQLNGGSSLIENVAITPIANAMATLTFNVKANATGKDTITLTAKGLSAYNDKSIKFNLAIEDNIAPTLDQVANMSIPIGIEQEITISGISDGNTTKNQPLTITVNSDDNYVITNSAINYTQGYDFAKLKFRAETAKTGVKIIVTIKDDGATNNTTSMTFTVNSFNNFNNPPKIDVINDVNLLLTSGKKSFPVTGICYGDEKNQTIGFQIKTNDPTIATGTVDYTIGSKTATLNVMPVKEGITTFTIVYTDNGSDGQNNGNRSDSIQFNINVLSDEQNGYVLPFNNVVGSIADGTIAIDNTKYALTTVSFGGYDNVMKINMTNKSNWEGIWYNMPELNLTNYPYMSMEIYPATFDTYWHVYFYDANGNRNAPGAHAERKFLPKNQWTSVFIDFRDPTKIFDQAGNPITISRITDLLWNLHDKNFPFPFTNCTGTVYVKNFRVGNLTILPNSVSVCTMNKLLDRGHIQSVNTLKQVVKLAGISDGNYKTDNVVLSVSSNNTTIADPTVTNVSSDGTATIGYSTGNAIGIAKIKVTVAAPGSEVKLDSFTVSVLSNDPQTANSITIDSITKYQTIRGFGTTLQNCTSNLDYYSTDLGASAARIGLINNQIEPINDNDDPFILDMSKMNRNIFDWNYLRNLHAKGVENFILTVWSPPAWMKNNLSESSMGGAITCDATDNKLEYYNYDEFAEMMVATCKLFKEEMGFDLTGVGIQNEPAFHEPYPSAILDPSHFAQLIVVVSKRFEQEGINVGFYAPEQVFTQGSNTIDQYIDAIQANTEANKRTQFIATHGYAADGIGAGSPDFSKWTSLNNNAKEGAYPKEMWMTETYKDYSNFSDAMYWAQALYGALAYGNITMWTSWDISDGALIDKMGNKTSMYYVSKNYFKFIHPGAARISCTSPNENILTTAYINNSTHGGHTAIVMINNNAAPFSYKITSANMPSQFDVYQTSEAMNCEFIGKVAATDVLLLPPYSVTTLDGSFGNNPPTIDQASAITIENSALEQQTITLTGITDGDIVLTQNITISAKSNNTDIIPNSVIVDYVQGESTATLHYTHLPSGVGNASITITVQDDGGVLHCGIETTTMTLKVNVLQDVNLAPTMNPIIGVSILEDSPEKTVVLTGISDGDLNKNQNLFFTITSDNSAFIDTAFVEYTQGSDTAVLHIVPLPKVFGNTNLNIKLKDNGGNSFNNGDMSVQQICALFISFVNHAPTLDQVANITVPCDATTKTIILTGINDGDQNTDQIVNFRVTSSNAAILANPVIIYTKGDDSALLKFTPLNQEGTVSIEIIISDNGGVANKGVNKDTVYFTITFTKATQIENIKFSDWKLYPNPAKDYLYVSFKNQEFSKLVITDISGNILQNMEINPSDLNLSINIQSYKSGIYFIRFSNNKEIAVKKFCINKF